MDFAENTLDFFLLLSGVPGRENIAGEKRNGDSGHGGLAGGEGGVEEHEGLESYLWVVLVDAGVAGRGPATGAGGRRRR